MKTNNPLLEFSIIVPAYNEENRIEPFLNDLHSFSKNFKNYEILLVNDGSTDNTLNIFEQFKNKGNNVKIISYSKNKGKGYAVKTGIFNSKGKKIIFIDSDGSIPPKEILKMIDLLDKYDAVVGSRAHKDSKIKTSTSRLITGVVFNAYANLLFKNNIKDHLCGFKGFKREIAFKLFNDLISRRWIFDVELFYKIRKNKMRLYELPIEWIHKDKSKIKLIDPLKMFFQLIVLRFKLLKIK